jgi:hypothetical protein
VSAQNTRANALDPQSRGLYRAGGISALVFGIAYIIIIVLYVPVGRPTGVEAWLANTSANATTWWGILWLSVLTDFLLVPIALALYMALQRLNRNAMLAATAFVELFVVLDLALTWTNIGALITFGGSYATAANDARRAVIVTAAAYPAAVVESNLIFVYNSLTLAIGILLTGLVMRRADFGRITAYVGILTGCLAITAVASSFFSASVSGITIILASTLTTVWYLMVSYKLLRTRTC